MMNEEETDNNELLLQRLNVDTDELQIEYVDETLCATSLDGEHSLTTPEESSEFKARFDALIPMIEGIAATAPDKMLL